MARDSLALVARTIRPGLGAKLDGISDKPVQRAPMLLERRLSLKPGESRTLTFLYGYEASGH